MSAITKLANGAPCMCLEERWRPVQDFAGLYEVSNYGRVKSISRWVPIGQGKRLVEGRVLKPHIGTAGYPQLLLSDGDRQEDASVHKLVAQAFVAGVGKLVRHLDGNKLNATAQNLAWGSYEDNEADKRRHGRLPFGGRHRWSKINTAIARDIRAMSERGLSQLEIAAQTGINRGTVGAVVRGERWRDE